MTFTRIRIALAILVICCTACTAGSPNAASSTTTADLTRSPETVPTLDAATTAPTRTAIPATLAPAPRFFNEAFSSKPVYWVFLHVDSGPVDPTSSVQDGFLVFTLPGVNNWAYGLYSGQQYGDVLVETSVQSRSNGDGSAGLVCRYDEKKGWYEFNIFQDQTYQLLYGQWLAPGVARYTPLYQGNSPAIHSDTNDIAFQCQGNTLMAIINGAPTRKWAELKFALQNGQVGLSASSFADAPFMLAFDWARVSEP